MKAPSYGGLVSASESTSSARRKNRGANTHHEALLRRECRAVGCRYPKHVRTGHGKPATVFSATQLAEFCDRDFWHGRHWKTLRQSRRTGANALSWRAKVARNRGQDRIVAKALRDQGWRVLRVWETGVLANPAIVARRIREALHAIH
jgi:DNA mismatch endonuclease Vsr